MSITNHFLEFEKLVDLSFPKELTTELIVTTLSTDLTAIDIKLISKNFRIIDVITKEEEFFTELAVLCRDKTYAHPEWGSLSGRIKMLFIKRWVPRTFSDSCEMLKPVLGNDYYNFCMLHNTSLDKIIDLSLGLDWAFDIFAVETLARGYLSRVKDDRSISHIAETPQYLYLRIAVFLWYPQNNRSSCSQDDPSDNLSYQELEKIKQCYMDLSTGKISPPSPLQFNAGMKRPQLASCFLLSVDDSMKSLSKNWHDNAIISMNNGGIGITFDSIRHSEIGNHGWSQGVTPWIKIVNEVLATVNQSGKRKGSGAMYLTEWHRDIFEFVDLKNPIGKEELRARDLFYGIMISDLFMQRVAEDGMWSLFCPAKVNELEKTYGVEFEKRYVELEERGLHGHFPHTFKQVRARELWLHIIRSQITTGMPYIVYKDAVNRKSNQKHLGTLRLSNLCSEIMEYVDKDNIASCNLSSIPVSAFVKRKDEKPYFDFEELGQVTRRAIRNLGQVINRNYYPDDIPEIKYANFRNRPIGIGIQDLAGCFALLDLCWDSLEAKELNEKIASTMYYHGMDENVNMAEEFGAHETFPGSPASEGLFQFDLWQSEEIMKKGVNAYSRGIPCEEYDLDALRKRMIKHGLYFCMLFAQMPTASSAHIRGNNESVEPYTQLLFARTVLSGQFTICVPHLVRDLEAIGMWNTSILKHLFANQGSIQDFPIDNLEESVKERMIYLKRKYRTAFELSQRITADLYLDRARYQCQSSSNNLFMKNPTATSVSAYHFYMWRGGAKTGMYYLRQTAGSDPLNFSMDSLKVTTKKNKAELEDTCTINCLSCHS
jgi:ribonucleoside-diphosphate reductase alpha chain